MVDKTSLVTRVRAVNRDCAVQSEYVVSTPMFHDVPVHEINLGLITGNDDNSYSRLSAVGSYISSPVYSSVDHVVIKAQR
jgi:hypothetical protein